MENKKSKKRKPKLPIKREVQIASFREYADYISGDLLEIRYWIIYNNKAKIMKTRYDIVSWLLYKYCYEILYPYVPEIPRNDILQKMRLLVPAKYNRLLLSKKDAYENRELRDIILLRLPNMVFTLFFTQNIAFDLIYRDNVTAPIFDYDIDKTIEFYGKKDTKEFRAYNWYLCVIKRLSTYYQERRYRQRNERKHKLHR